METTLYRFEDVDADDDLQEEPSTCAFFCFPCPPRRRQRGGLEHRSLLRGEPGARGETSGWEDSRPGRGVTKFVALLRRLGSPGDGGKRIRPPQFRYDPVSYALNFDDGACRGDEAAGRPFLAFSPGPPPSKDSCV